MYSTLLSNFKDSKWNMKHRAACYPLAIPFPSAQRTKISYNPAKKPIAFFGIIQIPICKIMMGTAISESQKWIAKQIYVC